MAGIDLEKLRSVGHVGKTRGKARVRKLDEGGRVRGFEIDHSDGRQSAVVRPDPVIQKVSIKEL